MTKKSKLRLMCVLIAIFISWPVSIYLQYSVLSRVNATELMWFLFIVNLPFTAFNLIISQIAKSLTEDE